MNQRGFAPMENLEPRRLMAAGIPKFDHVVIVIEENKAYMDIIGSADAPYLNSLANGAALFTQSFGVARPSQPNYLALFSGSTQGVTDNNAHGKFDSPNLYSELAAVGKTFAGYFDSMPSEGYDGEVSGDYARKHNPVTQFSDVPASANKVFNESTFPTAAGTDYSFLPTVSMIVPDLEHDMHDASVQVGDAWLQDHLDAYAQWAKTHNSLLIVTFDEDDSDHDNHIATFFYGAKVKPGQYTRRVDHYDVLRTLEDMYDSPTHANDAAQAIPITNVWTTSGAGVARSKPMAPANLLAVAQSATEIELSWKDRSKNEDEFVIERATDAAFSQNLIADTVEANDTHFVASGLDVATTYYFRVRASNVKGASKPTKIAIGRPTDEIVRLDNASVDGITGTGTWFRSTEVAGFHNEDYLEDANVEKGKKVFRFTPTLDTAGTYQVFLRWTNAADRAAGVPVEITSIAGTKTVRVNQKKIGGDWVLLGRFNFDPAVGPAMVTIRTGGTRGIVVADAVKFVLTLPDPELSKPRGRRNPLEFANSLVISDGLL